MNFLEKIKDFIDSNFFQLFIELIVVFLGVFASLTVDKLIKKRNTKAETESILLGIHDELIKISEELENISFGTLMHDFLDTAFWDSISSSSRVGLLESYKHFSELSSLYYQIKTGNYWMNVYTEYMLKGLQSDSKYDNLRETSYEYLQKLKDLLNRFLLILFTDLDENFLNYRNTFNKLIYNNIIENAKINLKGEKILYKKNSVPLLSFSLQEDKTIRLIDLFTDKKSYGKYICIPNKLKKILENEEIFDEKNKIYKIRKKCLKKIYIDEIGKKSKGFLYASFREENVFIQIILKEKLFSNCFYLLTYSTSKL